MDPDGARKTLLADRIAAQIHEDGPLTFARFMEAALYDPDLGYYTGGGTPWGDTGDYVTTPQVDPVLGGAIAALAGEFDEVLGRPDPFTLVEVGVGDGSLLSAVAASVEATAPELWNRLAFVAVERSALLRRQLCRRLPQAPRGVFLRSSIEQVDPNVRGGIYSNELFDAMPVHRLLCQRGELFEILVGHDGAGFIDYLEMPTDERLVAYLQENQIRLKDGQRCEICLEVAPWLDGAVSCLQHGFILTIDYGHETAALYGDQRPSGSLICQHRYNLSDDPYVRIGQQDITTHVDFGNLMRLGSSLGLTTSELSSLRVFLVGFGLQGEATLERPDLDAYIRLRHLLVSDIADRHRVLLQTKRVASPAVAFGLARLDSRRSYARLSAGHRSKRVNG